MEIQKIFSNVEDPEENLYSVLLSEDELALFSNLVEEPDIWKEYKLKINPEINKIQNSLSYHVFFCHALNNIEEDPTNKGYFIMFDTVPGLKWKEGEYYINKSSFFGLGKEKLTKISKSEALKYLGDRFCTTDNPLKLAKDKKIGNLYNKILNL